MDLIYQKITKENKDIKELETLFITAFPEEERPPFDRFISFDNHSIFGIYNEDKFIGFFSLVEKEDLVYLFFFAIKDEYRGKGFGSKTLKYLLNKYKDKRLFLLAESLDESTPNYKERLSRANFYTRNGLTLTNKHINEYGVDYQIITNDLSVTTNDFLILMEHILGDFYPIYKQHVY